MIIYTIYKQDKVNGGMEVYGTTPIVQQADDILLALRQQGIKAEYTFKDEYGWTIVRHN